MTTEITTVKQKEETVKEPAKEVIDYLNGLYTTEAGRLSIVMLPYFQGQTKHYVIRMVEALEKIADNLSKIASKK